MNREVFIISLISLIGLLAIVLYLFSPLFTKRLIGENDPFERKIFAQNLPFWHFIMLTVFYPLFIMVVVLLLFEINSRVNMEIFPVGEKITFWSVMLCLSLIGFGEGAHSASVSISHYMGKLKNVRAFQTVEFFHHILSHFLSIMGGIFLILAVALFEFNHPQLIELKLQEILILALGGVITGLVVGLVIIEGRGKYYGIPALVFGLMVLAFVFYDEGLTLIYYPFVIYAVMSYFSSLVTIILWRMKNGSLRETIGEFFHVIDGE